MLTIKDLRTIWKPEVSCERKQLLGTQIKTVGWLPWKDPQDAGYPLRGVQSGFPHSPCKAKGRRVVSFLGTE